MSSSLELGHRELELLRHIRNALWHEGTPPSVRDLMSLMGYRSPRSVSILIERLKKAGCVGRRRDGQIVLLKEPEEFPVPVSTVDVPLVGNVVCGSPILAEEHTEGFFPVSTALARPPHKYFMLRAKGDSMDREGIRDGNLVLVRQQAHANNGDIVVALIDTEATIKKFKKTGNVVALIPCSGNPKHRPIIVQNNFRVQGKVMKVIGNVGGN